MRDTYIWWLDKWALMMIDSLDEMAYNGHQRIVPIPGHIKMVLQGVAQDNQYNGRIVTPVTIDRIDLLNRVHPDWERVDLLHNHVGVAFESVHLATISEYPGIITNLDFNLISPR